jgi:hypothetical protein
MFDIKDADPAKAHKLQMYYHEIDGVRQEGLYLGALGKTTWGFVYRRPKAEDCPASGDAPSDYFDVKLQGLPQMDYVEPRVNYDRWGEYDPRFYGFLSVGRWGFEDPRPAGSRGWERKIGKRAGQNFT